MSTEPLGSGTIDHGASRPDWIVVGVPDGCTGAGAGVDVAGSVADSVAEGSGVAVVRRGSGAEHAVSTDTTSRADATAAPAMRMDSSRVRPVVLRVVRCILRLPSVQIKRAPQACTSSVHLKRAHRPSGSQSASMTAKQH
jgi:hypothetical protein